MNNTVNPYTFQCFTHEQIKEINDEIKKNIFQKEEKSFSSDTAIKIGEFSHVPCLPLMQLIHPWLYHCQQVNRKVFGYDVYWDFHLDSLNYNVYGVGGEYGWHVDATDKTESLPTGEMSCVTDMKLTCLLNLSEESYEGGEFYTISNPNEATKFTTGMGLVTTSMIAHKVTPVTKGERITLTYWAEGPIWR